MSEFMDSCSGKRSYDFWMARISAKWMRRNSDAVVVAYRCRYCHGWHVGGKGDHAHPYTNAKRSAMLRAEAEFGQGRKAVQA